jgi:hypothetical protein
MTESHAVAFETQAHERIARGMLKRAYLALEIMSSHRAMLRVNEQISVFGLQMLWIFSAAFKTN